MPHPIPNMPIRTRQNALVEILVRPRSMEKRSLADIAGPWAEPDVNSGLIERCRANWSVPVGEITNYVLATFIRQKIALDLVVPEAKRRIASGYIDDTEILDDELAIAIALI